MKSLTILPHSLVEVAGHQRVSQSEVERWTILLVLRAHQVHQSAVKGLNIVELVTHKQTNLGTPSGYEPLWFILAVRYWSFSRIIKVALPILFILFIYQQETMANVSTSKNNIGNES